MAIVLLIALVTLLNSAGTVSAESTSNVTVTNDVNSSSSSQGNCHNHVSVTINGQNKTVDNDNCQDLNVHASQNGGQTTINVKESSDSSTPKAPKPPTIPTAAGFPIPTPPATPSAPKPPFFPGISTQTAQISKQIDQFVQHIQSEFSSLFHNIFRL